jgi:hypothetical protein
VEEIPYSATFQLQGGVTASGTVAFDPDHLDPEVVAELIADDASGPAVCRQCADEIHDPELGALRSFSVGGRRFAHNGDRWAEE